MAVLNFDIKAVSLPNGNEAKAVFLSGSIDASTNQIFEEKLTTILDEGTNEVLLVLTNVKYINSTGLGTIVKCVDTFREKNGDIKLVGVPTKVIALFEMLGLLTLFEAYDTIEDAVTSFAAAPASEDSQGSSEGSAETASFPIQFKHPISGMGLNVSQPGKFKDPRSGDYFSVSESGEIEFYETTKVEINESRIPCDPGYKESILASAKHIIKKLSLPEEYINKADACVTETFKIIEQNDTNLNDHCNVLLVGDKAKLQIGFVTSSDALSAKTDNASLQAISSNAEVSYKTLPTRGQILSITIK